MSKRDKERDDLKYAVEKAVQKFLGFSEPTLVTASINCIDKGYDRRKAISKLSSYLDDRQASKFVEKLFDVVDSNSRHRSHSSSSSSSSSSRKRRDKERSRDDENTEEDVSKSKKVKRFEETKPPTNVVVPEPGQPSPGQLTADKIKDMMASAQRMIKERKAQLNIPDAPPARPPPPPQSQKLMSDAMDKAKKAADLQARIQAQLANAGIGVGVSPIKPPPLQQSPAEAIIPGQPTPLILDEMGRTIDVNTGETVQLTHHMPTLKANIRAKKREEFKTVISRPPEEISESKFFDPRVGDKGAVRQRRSFQFHDQGKFQEIAARLRTKAQLDKLQNEIAQAAKKTGIATMTRLISTQPKKAIEEGEIPNIEWWDNVILQVDNYDIVGEKGYQEKIKGVTHYVEHPIQMKPPVDQKSVEIKVMLTKKERKKLRRQNREEAQKEVTEKIRLGLMPAPEPKVKMANLMRVLGTEAVQDPTKIEAHVRAQMAKRQRGHEEANAARKLTPDQRKDKKAKKLKEDTTNGVHVAIYRIKEFKNPSKKFKVEANA
ncbi:unnamed protein product, partial [Owenia fusiformis]